MRALLLAVASLCLAGLLIALTAGPAGNGPPRPPGEPRTVLPAGPTRPLAPGVLLAFYDGHCPSVALLGTDWLGRSPDGLAALWRDPQSEPGLAVRFSSALYDLVQLRPTVEMWPRLPGQGTAPGFAMEVHFAPANFALPSVYVELRGVGYVVNPAGPRPVGLFGAYVISGAYCL